MKRGVIALIGAAAVVAAVYGTYRYYLAQVRRTPVTPAVKTVTIPAGYTTAEIASLLAEEGLIAEPRAFVWYCRLNGFDGKLQAGRYELSSEEGIPALAATLAAGRVRVVRFTIPEGYTKEKTAAALEAAGVCPVPEFLAACDRGDPRGRLPGEDLEGYLFGDTYEVEADAGADEIVATMVDRFFEVWEAEAAPEVSSRARGEVVTLASIVEREAMLDEERPLVASVFHNRLARGMRLESCATVIYALGGDVERLTIQDLQVDSPYNTYVNGGLPPGPICSPGRASLRAALNPAATDYLFFVSNGDGSHTFSRTLRGHLTARANKEKPN
ncbi:MAG: endolytic transglycosylase MltG [Candidatus Coatesbacteria bacterium]|nr:MAG: endolytic transglycosylase MltG [Candidatus Coatesbacteria bacterium]